MKQKIIFSIANYNTKDFLDSCIKSIMKTQKEYKIFVIDNASTDGSSEMIKRKYSSVNLIQNKTNVGFGAAHNQVLKKTEFDLAVITNSDIIFLKDIRPTINELNKNQKIGACSLKLVNPDKTIQKNVFPVPSLKTEIMSRLPLLKDPYSDYYFNYEKRAPVECFNGACFIARKKALEEVGYFDETFFAYVEETDLITMMKKKGWLIFFSPSVSVIHFGGKTTKDTEKKHIMYFTNLLFFFAKHYGKPAELCLRSVSAISAVCEIFKCVLLAAVDHNALKGISFNIKIIRICLNIQPIRTKSKTV